MVKIPDGIDIASAGPLSCGGITAFNPLLQYDIKPTDKVAVIGIGKLGHLALQFLNAWGCEVTAFTSTSAKRKEALDLGVDHTLNSREQKELERAESENNMLYKSDIPVSILLKQPNAKQKIVFLPADEDWQLIEFAQNNLSEQYNLELVGSAELQAKNFQTIFAFAINY